MHNIGRPNLFIRLSEFFCFAAIVTTPPSVAAASTLTISGSPPTAAVVGKPWGFGPKVSGGNGKTLQFSMTYKPGWTSLQSITGYVYGTPPVKQVHTAYSIVISATDGTTTASPPAFNIASAVAPAPPTISGTPALAVVAGHAYAFVPTATGLAGTPLGFSIASKPSWATFSIATGELSGTPTGAQTGTYSDIVISVSNGTSKASLAGFSIVVSAATAAPTISGAPAKSAIVGQAYAFTPKASVASGKKATFTTTNKPPWASFSATTGELSGTPAATNVGTISNIMISVGDGTSKASLAAFSIVVSAATAAPTISGAPAKSVVAGQAYAFMPKASVASGKKATFTIANKPLWASFSATTGELSGMPAVTNVGTCSNIIISVSDGTTKISLPTFAITVTQVGSKSVTISWAAPTENSNGTALTNLAGYRIYWGTSAASLTQTITISSVGVTTNVVSNLGSGTYFFALMAYNTAGVESKLSNVVSKAL